MERITFSHYGWILITVIILSVLMSLATPFGMFVNNGIQATTTANYSYKPNENDIKKFSNNFTRKLNSDYNITLSFYEEESGEYQKVLAIDYNDNGGTNIITENTGTGRFKLHYLNDNFVMCYERNKKNPPKDTEYSLCNLTPSDKVIKTAIAIKELFEDNNDFKAGAQVAIWQANGDTNKGALIIKNYINANIEVDKTKATEYFNQIITLSEEINLDDYNVIIKN